MAVKFDSDTSGDFGVSGAIIRPCAWLTFIMALSSKITAILTDWVNSQPLTNPVMCLGHRPVMVRVNLFKEISTSSQRQEIGEWYHLKENLYKVGGDASGLNKLRLCYGVVG